MKKLPEHSPKHDTWERILSRGEFESQLDTHLPNLPQYQPKQLTWERITEKLDQKKATPVWIPWSIAAAVVAILFLTGIDQEWIGKEAKELSPLTNRQNDAPNPDIQIPFEEKAQVAEMESTNPENEAKDSPKRKPAPRAIETIEVPKMALPELNLAQTGNLSLEIQESQILEPSPPKTLHQVSVSWSKIKPGLQVKTTFGRKEAELGQKPQASADPAGQLILEINN